MLSLKYRIYPSGKQQAKLNHSLWLAKELHNNLLQYCKDKYTAYKNGGDKFSPSKFSLSYEIARMRKENPEYKNEYAHELQEVGGRIGTAYSSFFRRVRERKKGSKVKAGFPRFKKKVYSLTYPDAYGTGYKLESNKILNVSKIGRIPIKLDRAPKGNIKTMVISKDGNRWYASFSTDHNKVMDKISKNRTPVGVDMGVKTFAALSDGTLIENPKFYKQDQKKIRKLQRRLSRKVKGSHNRKKAGMKLWQAHQRVEDLRSDFIHKVTTDLVRNHNIIAVENLKIGNMLHNHNLAGSISDSGWGIFKTYLDYKAESAGSQVIYVEPKNTTQACSCCNLVLDEKLKLDKRVFKCPSCGHEENRDVNAAKNILSKAFELANKSRKVKSTTGQVGSYACRETTSIPKEIMNSEQVVSLKQELNGGAYT